MRPTRALGPRWWRLGAVVGLVVASFAVAAPPASANIIPPEGVAQPGIQAAGGCWNEGCTGKYYNYGGPHCTDARAKSDTLYDGFGSSTTWNLHVYYSHACGAGFAYVKNLTEKPGVQCYVETWYTFNDGYTWHGHASEPIDAGYTYAYTTMVGDADPHDKVRGRVRCHWPDGGIIWSEWTYEH